MAVGSGTGKLVGGREEVRPWVRAFWAERDLPSLVRGPVDFWAFCLFRAARAARSSSLDVGVRVLEVDSDGKAMLHMSDPLC